MVWGGLRSGGVRLRAAVERFRSSLFFFPVLFVGGAVVFGQVMLAVDGRVDTDALPGVARTTVDSARAVLATITAATITVAAVVFSVTVVSAQLATSQLSPRVLRIVIRDRFQQVAMGWMVGTFTYGLVVLRAVRGPGEEGGDPVVPNMAVSVAVVLAIVAVVMILGYIDRSARLMQAGRVIRRITDETVDAACRLMPEHTPGSFPPPCPPAPAGDPLVVRAEATGWIQQLDTATLLRSLPPGALAHLAVRVGGFVAPGAPLVLVWPAQAGKDSDLQAVSGAFALGPERTMQQDLAFGIRQLVDIGLRALSPGVNDATTAYEVVVHLGAVLRVILLRDLPSPVQVDDRGTTVVRPHDFTHDDYVRRALDQLRINAAGQPGVMVALCNLLGTLVADMDAAGLGDRTGSLCEQAHLALEACAATDLPPADLQPIRDALDHHGLDRNHQSREDSSPQATDPRATDRRGG